MKKRSLLIQVVVDSEEKEIIDENAEEENRSISGYIRNCIDEAIKRKGKSGLVNHSR